MAQTISEFNFQASNAGVGYPYGDWLNGAIWELSRNADFGATPKAMQAMLRKAAKKRGLKLRAKSSGDKLVIQAY